MISIIIPVYNVEQYLHKCLDSILCQRYLSWECILIDDGSIDNSLSICENYEKKDHRFTVIHKENGGVSSARNLGIKKAKGEWLLFIDADDILIFNALSVIEDAISNHHTDFYMFGYDKISENGDYIFKPKNEIIKLIDKKTAIIEMYKPSIFPYQGYLWCKVFNRNIIKQNNLLFDESISFNEDRLFIVNYICCISKNIYYSTLPIYHYIERETGAMSSIFKSYNPKWHSDFYAYVEMYHLVNKHYRNIEIISLAKNHVFKAYRGQIKYLGNFKIKDRLIKKELNTKYKEVFPFAKITGVKLFVFFLRCKNKFISLLKS